MTRREMFAAILGGVLSIPAAAAEAQISPNEADPGNNPLQPDDFFTLNLMINITRLQMGLDTILEPGENGGVVEIPFLPQSDPGESTKA